MKTKTSLGTLAEKISSGLKKAEKEIEGFALQASLGKAKAGDKFEELKKEIKEKAIEWKHYFSNLKSANSERADALKSKLDELQLQLALGKADAKDYFIGQKKKILDSLHEFESGLRDHPDLKEKLNDFKIEIEKFKLKMDILELKFELQSLKGKEKIKDAIGQAGIEADKIFMKAGERWDEAKTRSMDFSKDISDSIGRLKKAVMSLRDKDKSM